MLKIRNAESLTGHGAEDSRRLVLEIADTTLARLDAYHRIKSIARLDGSTLRIGTRTWDLATKRHVYLVGAGKAGNAMAAAVDEILGDRLTKGIVIVKMERAPGDTESGLKSADLKITFTASDFNEPVTVETPASPLPFEQLGEALFGGGL